MTPPRLTAKPPTPRLGADDWVRAALDIMVDEGIGGVKIQRLCDRLGVTKGSFYWHFVDLDAFLTEVARCWAEDGAHLPGALDAEPDRDRKLLLAMQLFVDPRNRNLARAMRDWARSDERARAAIHKADEAVFSEVKAELRRRGFDDDEAEVRAKILYYSGIGYAHVGNLGRRDSAERQLAATWDLLAGGDRVALARWTVARPRIEATALPRISRRRAASRAAKTTAVFATAFGAAPVAWARSGGRARGAAIYGGPLRRAAERLGPTYVKLGQLLASSPTIAGEGLADELRGLLDRGRGMPLHELRRIVEADTGRPFDEVFARFETTPHAAASLAVVHRAVLADGRNVAVKVLRPGTAELIAADLALLEPLFGRLSRLAPVGIVASLPGAVAGLAGQLAEELDLRNEARSMTWFRAMLEVIGVDGVVVPEVVPEASGARVLTMEFIEGRPVDDLGAVDDLDIDGKAAIEALLRSWFAIALCTGTFHGDMHAGNLLLTPDGRVALLDWGILGRMDQASWRFLRRSIEGAMGDESAWADVRAHIMPTVGSDVARMTGLDEDQIFDLIRGQILAIMSQPFDQLNLMALAPSASSLDAGAITGTLPPPPSGLRAWVRLARDERRRLRTIDGPPPSAPPHGEVLLVKQLLYFERYGRLYIGDRPLIWDEAVFRDLLALPTDAST